MTQKVTRSAMFALGRKRTLAEIPSWAICPERRPHVYLVGFPKSRLLIIRPEPTDFTLGFLGGALVV